MRSRTEQTTDTKDSRHMKNYIVVYDNGEFETADKELAEFAAEMAEQGGSEHTAIIEE